MQHTRGILALLVCALLWGTSYPVAKDALVSLSPSLLILGRFVIAGICFLPWTRLSRSLLLAGAELGFWLVCGYGTQTIGLLYTTAGRSAFISSLFVILVPLLLGLLGQRIPPPIWIAAGMALLGIGLLSSTDGNANIGDFWCLATALCWGIYIIRLERLAQHHSPLPLTIAQIWNITLLTLIWVLAEQVWQHPGLRPTAPLPWWQLVYLGIGPTALTTWLQTFGQQWVNPAEVVVLFTLEPIAAAMLAFLYLGEWLTAAQLIGAGLIVGATLLSQVPARG